MASHAGFCIQARGGVISSLFFCIGPDTFLFAICRAFRKGDNIAQHYTLSIDGAVGRLPSSDIFDSSF